MDETVEKILNNICNYGFSPVIIMKVGHNKHIGLTSFEESKEKGD